MAQREEEDKGLGTRTVVGRHFLAELGLEGVEMLEDWWVLQEIARR